MPFEIKVALRYLRSSGLQSALILAGVAVGIIVFTFMAALITGLDRLMIDNVLGNLAHISLEPRQLEPTQIEPSRRTSHGHEAVPAREALPVDSAAGSRWLVAIQKSNERRLELRGWRPLVELIEATPGLTAVSPQVVGNGFVQRGEKILPIEVTGLLAGHVSDIIDLEAGLLRGSTFLGPGEILIGRELADDLGIDVGQRIRFRSDRRRSRTLTVRGVFDVGSAALNRRSAFVDLRTAQSLFDLEGAISRIGIKVVDIFAATRTAQHLADVTGLEAKDWITQNDRLQRTLRSQRTTGALVRFFSLLTIVISVASVLLLAANRRRAEIGILLSLGVSRRSVSRIFQIQGLLIGLFGSSLGAFLGWIFCLVIREAVRLPDGTAGLPVDPAGGQYLTAVVLATLAGVLAAVLPARAAARVDPVEVIQQ